MDVFNRRTCCVTPPLSLPSWSPPSPGSLPTSNEPKLKRRNSQPGLRSETVRPERLERLAQDTYTGLDSLRFLSAVTPGRGGDRDSEARERVGELKQKIDKLLQSPSFPRSTNFYL